MGLGAQRDIERLMTRERGVLRTLAADIHFGVGRIRNHLVIVLGDLEVNPRLQALVFALRHGVVEINSTPESR